MAKARKTPARAKAKRATPKSSSAKAKRATPKRAAPKRAAPKRTAAKRAPKRAPKRAAPRQRGAEVLLTLPPITDVERAAFEAQFTDAACEARGNGAAAADVLSEAASAVDAIASAVLAGALRYGPTRLRHLLDLLGDLKTLLDDERRGGANELEDAMEEASVVREELQHAIALVARGDARGSEELDRARSHESVAASLKGLADCARYWIERGDEVARTLVAAHGLRRADVDAALRAARRLDRALTSARTGATPGRDLPPRERLVGRVLLEVELLALATNKAHADNPVVPVLPLGRVLRPN